ncbi:hypothetical protein [Ammoniphilus sp. CFH 90114]|uniref:hypothetical protein n=1 Tax=Ammoniphilus sp. CFH 90114 TaxID=2493665 RepID=UPI00100E12D6|nr:hypothetical protein [Ammoniphilus sp. CFH 90114]RXT14931.1 hypothetical protein EIZ39_01605 [Ammoniphilus sp. CFH 90114]
MLAYKSFLDPLVKNHPTLTIHLKDKSVTGDLYNTSANQVVLLVHGGEYHFEVIPYSEIQHIDFRE